MDAGISSSGLWLFGSVQCGPASSFSFSILCQCYIWLCWPPSIKCLFCTLHWSGSCFDCLVTRTLRSTFVNTSFFFSEGIGHTWSKAVADHLLEDTPDERLKTQLLTSTCKEMCAWLNVLPLSQCGLQMDDETVRVAWGWEPFVLLQPEWGWWGEGRHPRHSASNDIICRSLVAANVPSQLQPTGLYRFNGKRPDGISLIPWKNWKCLIRDATCPDTYTPSHMGVAAGDIGKVA